MKRYIKAAYDVNNSDAFSSDSATRCDFARNTSDEGLMWGYAYDCDEDVRCNLAVNPNIPMELLVKAIDVLKEALV